MPRKPPDTKTYRVWTAASYGAIDDWPVHHKADAYLDQTCNGLPVCHIYRYYIRLQATSYSLNNTNPAQRR